MWPLREGTPNGLDVEIMSPEEATIVTCQRATDSLNTITVTDPVTSNFDGVQCNIATVDIVLRESIKVSFMQV